MATRVLFKHHISMHIALGQSKIAITIHHYHLRKLNLKLQIEMLTRRAIMHDGGCK